MTLFYPEIRNFNKSPPVSFFVKNLYDSDSGSLKSHSSGSSHGSRQSQPRQKQDLAKVTDLILLRRKFISKTLKEKEILFGQKERLAKLNERLAKLELNNKEAELRKKQLAIQVRRAEKGETDEAKTTREQLTKDLAEVNKHFEECSKLRKDFMYASVKARSVDEITVANAEGDVKMYDAKITEMHIKIAKFERDLAENVQGGENVVFRG